MANGGASIRRNSMGTPSRMSDSHGDTMGVLTGRKLRHSGRALGELGWGRSCVSESPDLSVEPVPL